MLDLILNLIPGGQLAAIGAIIVAALGAVFGIYRSGRKAGVNAQKAKEAKANEELLDQARRAADARRAAERGGVPDGDPNDRDNG